MKLLLCIFFMSLSAMSEQEMRIIPNTESIPLLHAERQTCNPLTDGKKAILKLYSGWFKTFKYNNTEYDFNNIDRACVYPTLGGSSMACMGTGIYLIISSPATACCCVSSIGLYSTGILLGGVTILTGYSDYKEAQKHKLQRNRPSAIIMNK